MSIYTMTGQGIDVVQGLDADRKFKVTGLNIRTTKLEGHAGTFVQLVDPQALVDVLIRCINEAKKIEESDGPLS